VAAAVTAYNQQMFQDLGSSRGEIRRIQRFKRDMKEFLRILNEVQTGVGEFKEAFPDWIPSVSSRHR